MPYKLLVCALDEATGEELAQLVSQSFSVSVAPFCFDGNELCRQSPVVKPVTHNI